FRDFKNIFPDDDFCYKYLSRLKWKSDQPYYCKKCSFELQPGHESINVRCGRCGYLESVTYGTLYQGLRFPILKAFYITYRTSTALNDSMTLSSLAEEIELRLATLSVFRQKVILLIEENKAKKKHRDGWTHLVEYSMVRGQEK
ncbi:MAG TPA: hypothetical protein VF691_20425, partial [Cytophagaceae bacterium]